MNLSPGVGVDDSPMKSSDQETFYSCESQSPTPGQSLDQTPADTGTNTPESSEEFVTSNCVTEKLVGIKLPSLTYPKSQYSPWVPPLPVVSPRAATAALVSSKSSYQGEEFIALDLSDFTFYRTAGGPYSHEMVPLQEVASKLGTTTFLLDGILSNGDNRVYLERTPFKFVSTGGYENVKQHSIGLDLWIQSVESRKSGIWYRLLKPAPEYARFHESFLWLANLGKHVVDYISENEEEIKRITLLRFQRDFALFLQNHHKGVSEFESWYSQHQSMDFRQAVIAHGDYLQKQAIDIDAHYGKCPLWSEIGVTSSIVKEQPQYESQTVLTPYVFDCFEHMDWAHHLKPINLDIEVKEKQRQRLEALGFVQKRKPPIRFGDNLKSALILRGKTTISCGDVIATKRDTKTVWKGNHDDLWYAFVQHIEDRKGKGRVWLHVIWLYKPSDTVCANMVYPFDNELFMSDHCNCANAKIEATEVVQKVNVSFFSDGTNVKKSDFFIRQSYHSEDETFATLKEEDFCCNCRTNTSSIPTHNYTIGDTVLVESICNDDIILEPAEIMNIQQTGDIEIRELQRRGRDFKELCRPNELVYTNKFREIHIDQIDRRCDVRLYTQEDVENGSIPAPYNRDGNGDAFYITSQEGNTGLQPIQVDSTTFKQGFDPNHSDFRRLRALNIFSGGGSFDRGLEEGAAIQNEWAVEWGVMPILTYRANHSDPDKLKLFCGSVNDYLSMAIRGKGQGKSQNVAQIGQPDFLSAGSPCQGYSLANPQKATEGALRNCSMVASVMAFVDLYRFKYGLLENVTAMANKSIKKNPLSQILCCLVGMGYQCRILNLDAWSFGAPQSRSRLFVSFAAPGLELPDHPQLTHSHPVNVKKRSLGRAANGLPFGNRRWQTPVFDFVTAAKSLSDLPEPGVMCISKPDHRPSRNESLLTQTRINQIPKAPRLQGLADATERERLNQLDIYSMPNSSKLACMGSRAWSRIHPHGLIPTVTTAVSPACRFTGRWLHWDQDRLITVMEARRAQGYPDDEVLVGRPANQWKIVGNSVARQVALGLGVSLREACLENEKRRQSNGQSSVTGKLGEAVILSETEDEDEERRTSTLDHYDAMGEAMNALSQFQSKEEISSTLNGDPIPIRKNNLAVEISSQDSSRSMKSTRTAPTSTEPSSRDEEAISIPSKKRSLGDYQPLVISDGDEEPFSPIRRKKRKTLLGEDRSSPIILN